MKILCMFMYFLLHINTSGVSWGGVFHVSPAWRLVFPVSSWLRLSLAFELLPLSFWFPLSARFDSCIWVLYFFFLVKPDSN